MSSIGTRMDWPVDVASMIWSDMSTGKDATNGPVAQGLVHGEDTFAATLAHGIAVTGRQFAGSAGRDRQDQVFCFGHFRIALGRKLTVGVSVVVRIHLVFRHAGHQPPLLEISAPLGRIGFEMPDYGHRHDMVVASQLDATHAGRAAAFENAHGCCRETDGSAACRHKHYIVIFSADSGIYKKYFIRKPHRDLAVCLDVREVAKGIAPHVAVRSREENLQLVPFLLITVGRHYCRDGYA